MNPVILGCNGWRKVMKYCQKISESKVWIECQSQLELFWSHGWDCKIIDKEDIRFKSQEVIRLWDFEEAKDPIWWSLPMRNLRLPRKRCIEFHNAFQVQEHLEGKEAKIEGLYFALIKDNQGELLGRKILKACLASKVDNNLLSVFKPPRFHSNTLFHESQWILEVPSMWNFWLQVPIFLSRGNKGCSK